MSKNKKSSVEGLESSETQTVVVPVTENKKLTVEQLMAMPFAYNEEQATPKFDAEREPKIQAGLLQVEKLMPGKINPLVIVLAKHWENKSLRAQIKDLIDAEAEAKNIPADVYLAQLREVVLQMAEMAAAVDRMRYATNYFKPRAGIGAKGVYKQFRIGATTYNVNLLTLDEARKLFPTPEEKQQLIDYLVQNSEPVQIEEL